VSTTKVIQLLDSKKWNAANRAITRVLEAKMTRVIAEARAKVFREGYNDDIKYWKLAIHVGPTGVNEIGAKFNNAGFKTVIGTERVIVELPELHDGWGAISAYREGCKKAGIDPDTFHAPMIADFQIISRITEATWHQMQAGPIKYPKDVWTVEIDPPNQARSFMTFTSQQQALIYRDNVEEKNPDIRGFVHVRPPTVTEARELSVPEKHQLKIAKQTLNMPDAMVGVMGGPDKEEAREIIKKLTGKVMKEDADNNDGNGFYVMGQHTSVAWYLTRDEAERDCKQMNYRGGTNYRVEPADDMKKRGMGASGKFVKEDRQDDWDEADRTGESDNYDEPDEPGEEDITTDDHENFYYLGKKIASSPAECKAWMKKQNYFPDVWFISDHGNAHHTSLDEAAYQPKTGEACSCKPGQQRDNCPSCEGTGQRIDFAKIRAKGKEVKEAYGDSQDAQIWKGILSKMKCPDCGGKGYTDGAKCDRCKGAGEVKREDGYNYKGELKEAVRQTACKYCDLDIENFHPYKNGEWMDRGGNTNCQNGPNKGKPHSPNRPLNEDRDRAIRYQVQLYSAGHMYTPAAWDVRFPYGPVKSGEFAGKTGLGKPTDANLAKYVKDFESGTQPGQPNDHLGVTKITRAEIIDNNDSKKVVATYRAGINEAYGDEKRFKTFDAAAAPPATLVTRQKRVNNFFGEIGGKYWQHIPMDQIFAKCRENGFEPVQEDETPWEGLLLGKDSSAKIKLNTMGDKGQPMTRYLVVSYHKMEVSGNYEVTAYVS
jgi:hypothetical protein